MNTHWHPLADLLPGGYLAHVASICGFLLALFLIAKLMNERRSPANTVAWLMGIVFIPWLGVPLYLLLGGRKLRRLARDKGTLRPGPAHGEPASLEAVCVPVARTVEKAGGFSPLGGNAMRLLLTGEEDFEEMERQILQAKYSIHITTFILGRDATGRRIIELLARRAREGVKVRLLLDALGCFRSSGSFADPLRAAGGEVGRFMPVMPFTSRGSANLRNHRKLAIFDGTRAIIGGRNLAREYMGPFHFAKRWRDFGAVVEGPVVSVLDGIFAADWTFATRKALTPAPVVACRNGTAVMQVVASGPDVPGDPLFEGIVSMIQNAEHNIWIVTPYFIPDDVILRSLIVKARAGVHVTLIVPAHSNHPVTDFARRNFTRELSKAGGQLLLYRPGMLHAKAIVVDNHVALVGSPNCDLRSLFVNFEIGVLIHTESEVTAIRSWIRDLVHHSAPAGPLKSNALTQVAEDLCRLLAPLL